MCITTALPVVQDVRQSHGVLARFHGIMGDLLAEVRRTPPSPNSIAAHLLAIDDPRTGAHGPPRARHAPCARMLALAHGDMHAGMKTCTCALLRMRVCLLGVRVLCVRDAA